MTEIRTNKELAEYVKCKVASSNLKKSYIYETLGMTRFGFDKFLTKKSFSLDDANSILRVLGVEEITIEKE